MTKLVVLHHQVYLTLRNQLLSGLYPADGDGAKALPSEVELARQFGVSRVTIRRSLDTLEKDKLIVRRHGAGTFPVSLTRPAPQNGNLSDFYSELTSRTFGYDQKVLAYGRTATPAHILASAPDFGATCLHLAVLSQRDNKPIHINKQYLCDPHARLLDRKIGDNVSLLLQLKEKGVSPATVDFKISATEADLEAADMLQVAVGSALLTTRRTSKTSDGAPFEFLEALTRPDRYSYSFQVGDRGGAPRDPFDARPRPPAPSRRSRRQG